MGMRKVWSRPSAALAELLAGDGGLGGEVSGSVELVWRGAAIGRMLGPARAGVFAREALGVWPAAALAAVDLAVKESVPTPPWSLHQRSGAWLALSALLLLAVLGLALVRSMVVALAAGVMSGGIIGNLVSAGVDGNRVPNPLWIAGLGHGVAFNLADVFFLVGDLLLVLALIHVLLRYLSRLAFRL